MNFFRRIFRHHQRVPSSAVSGTVFASSVGAAYFYQLPNDDEIKYSGNYGSRCNKNSDGVRNCTAIWKLSAAVSTVTSVTRTKCKAIDDSEENGTLDQARQYEQAENDRPRLIFLGTGSSTGCPKPICAFKFQDRLLPAAQTRLDKASKSSSSPSFRKPDPMSCEISHRALAGGDPKTNRDYRNNPCLLIHLYDERSKKYMNVLIDVGKTFRETSLRWFPIHRIKSLDAIILTHHHMDAAGGLDDVRGFQGIKWIADNVNEKENKRGRSGRSVRQPIPLYMSEFCHSNLESQFPWLLPKKSRKTMMSQQPKTQPAVKRDVASFDVTIFKDYQEEVIIGAESSSNNTQMEGFEFVPLPVWHGDDLISHGFAFSLNPGPASSSSSRSLNVVYLSDISRMVPKTLEFIQTKLPPTDILIVDSLYWDKQIPVHFSMEQAVNLSQTLQPRIRTYLIGMSCDDFLSNDEMNVYLKHTYGKSRNEKNDSEGVVAMAHDGLVIELPGDNV